MHRQVKVKLGDLIIALSEVIDLADPFLNQHQLRTAFAVWKMGEVAGLSSERLERLFLGALLHDIGAFSLKEKLTLRNFENEDIEGHCIRGEILLKQIPWLKDSARIVRFHHVEWSHWNESIETPFVFESQLICLADYVERYIDRERYILHQYEDIISIVKALSGVSFHPQVVDLFMMVSTREEFWLDMVSPRLSFILLNGGPFGKVEMGFSDLSLISELFRNIIDFRSRFTSTHSAGVSASAYMIAKTFGLTETEVELIKVAGNLHDVGKLAMPNVILEKPGKLTKKEMAIMKSHAYYTYFIINSIGGLQHIAECAAYHHEKLDGSGYPFHCTARELNIGARIMMVADIFTALVEDRPYRKGKLSQDSIVRILSQFSERNLLDPRIVNVLLDNYEEIFSYVTEKQASARDFYERQFSSLDQKTKHN